MRFFTGATVKHSVCVNQNHLSESLNSHQSHMETETEYSMK